MSTSPTRKMPFVHDYQQLAFRHDPDEGILWYFMQPEPRPCFTPGLLDEIKTFQNEIKAYIQADRSRREDVKFLVLGSRLPGVFNLGGDLSLFLDLIARRDSEALESYAKACIDVLYPNAVSLNLPITTISLLQGNALGGGFEAALSSSVIIAERSAQMGLPEILFNLFPGMGAYSFLSRRLDGARAERLILSGRNYTAPELYDMGIVDVLAEDGEGEEAVYSYVKKQKRCRNGTMAVHRVRRMINPLSYEELMEVALLWVDAALRLEAKDLRVMERLVKAQNLLAAADTHVLRERRMGDRRNRPDEVGPRPAPAVASGA